MCGWMEEVGGRGRVESKSDCISIFLGLNILGFFKASRYIISDFSYILYQL